MRQPHHLKRTFLVIMAFMMFSIETFAQQSVSGQIRNKDGEVIPDVLVVGFIDGKSTGTMADADGMYQISVDKNSDLLFTAIGFKTQKQNVEGRGTIDVVLEVDAELEEAVVVGFATQKKTNLTGSVSTVKSEELADVPVSDPVLALQGKVPGLAIKQVSGQLYSKPPTMTLRGQGTIGQGSSGGVLVLIDGMEGDLRTLNPQDIESISVLKDASASAIYGSRAPFGVILVTTKKGRKGKAVISYSNSFRFNTPLNLPHSADSYSWAWYFNEAANNDGNADDISPARLRRIKDYMDGVISYNTIPVGNQWGTAYTEGNDNIDYYDVFYKKRSFAHEHNLSVSGGTDKINYYVSGNYMNQDGLFAFEGDNLDGLRRLHFSGRFEAKPFDFLTIGYHSRFIRENYYQPCYLSDNILWYFGQYLWPVAPLYDPNGNLFNDVALSVSRGGRMTISNTTFNHLFNVILEPLKGWRIVADANYRYVSYFNNIVNKTVWQTCIDGVSKGSSWIDHSGVANDDGRFQHLNVNAYTDYENSIRDHYFKVMAGMQMETWDSHSTYAKKEGLIVPDVPSLDTASGLFNGEEVSPIVAGGMQGWRTMGFFGRINYNYKEKYLAEVNLRYDGSSRFAAENRWGLFPSVSLGYNIAREPYFMPASKYFSVLKFRMSYGSLGNQNTTSFYPMYQRMGFRNAAGEWLINGKKTNIAWPASLISSGLTWEKVRSWNVGLDAVAFDNRLSASIDGFIRRTEDMTGPADELPAILGTAVPYTNNTDLESRGFEFQIEWKDIAFKALEYGVRFTLADAVTKIIRYSNPSKTLGRYYAGMRLGDFYGYETIDIARSDEQMQEHLISLPNGGQNALGSNWQSGDIMYKDLNGDGKIDSGSWTTEDHGDLKIIGNSTPRYNFGLDIFAAWRGVDLKIFLQGIGKRDYFQKGKYFFGSCGWSKWGTMVLRQHLDYFRDNPENPLGINTDSYYPRPYLDTEKNVQFQTKYVQDASYVRLKNLQLGYTLPNRLTGKAGIQKLRIFFSGENLLTYSPMTDLFDPETIGENDTGNVYPLARVYSFGLNITF